MFYNSKVHQISLFLILNEKCKGNFQVYLLHENAIWGGGRGGYTVLKRSVPPYESSPAWTMDLVPPLPVHFPQLFFFIYILLLADKKHQQSFSYSYRTHRSLVETIRPLNDQSDRYKTDFTVLLGGVSIDHKHVYCNLS